MKKREPIPRKVIAYLRVSSDRQEIDSQRHELQEYADRNGLHVDSWIELEMSATKNGYKKRRIEELLNTVKSNDVLLVSEISRLARSVKECHEITGALLKKKVQTHFVKQNLQLRDDLPSKIMVNAFGLAAEIESEMISKRVKAGMQNAKAKGRKLGNPKWGTLQDGKVRKKEADAFARSLEKTLKGYLAQGMTQRAIVDELNSAGIRTRRNRKWHLATVQGIMKRLEKMGRV